MRKILIFLFVSVIEIFNPVLAQITATQMGMLDFKSMENLRFERFINEKDDAFKRLGLRPIWIRNRENFIDDLVNGFRKLSRVRKK